MPSWKISVLSQAAEPGSRPPTSPWCAVVVAKPIERLVEEDRPEDEDVLQVDAAVERVVHHEHVAGPHPVAPLREQVLHRVAAPSRGGTARSPPARPSRRSGRRARRRSPSRRARPSSARCGRSSSPSRRRSRRARCRRSRCVTGSTRCWHRVTRLARRIERLGVRVDGRRRPARADDDGRVVLVDQHRPRLRRRCADRARACAPASRPTVVRQISGVRARARRARRASSTTRGASTGASTVRAPRGAAPRISIGEPGLAAHAVQPLVLVLERRDQRGESRRARRQLDLDLPASGRRSGARRCAATRPPCRRRPARAAPPARRTRVELAPASTRARVEVARVHVVELGPREQQAERAEEPRERGHEHRPAAELLGEPGRVHRARRRRRRSARTRAGRGPSPTRPSAARASCARSRARGRRRRPRASVSPSGSATRADRRPRPARARS